MDGGALGFRCRLPRASKGLSLAQPFSRSTAPPRVSRCASSTINHAAESSGAFRASVNRGRLLFGTNGSLTPKVPRLTARGKVRCEDAKTKTRATAAAEAMPSTWEGAKLLPLALTFGVGLALRFLVPIPEGITVQGWTLLSIFLSTISGLVLEPLPTGAVALLGLTASILTGTLTFGQATAAMTSEVIWLIVVSFFFAKGFELTGLGKRVALLFVNILGRNTLGLSFGLNVAEGLISPAMPSTTARAGGIFVPIMRSVAQNAGSNPGEDSRLKLGAYLVHSQFQTSSHTSALFLTAAAQNLLCLKLAADYIGTIPNPFGTWFIGALVPAILGLVLTPLIMFKVIPPALSNTPEAPREARLQLDKMGPMSGKEWIMLGTMLLAITLWVFGDGLGVPAVVAGMIGLCILLLTGTLKWSDCLNYGPAWDTFFWFAVLISLSGQLNTMGVIEAFSAKCGAFLTSLNLGHVPLFCLLHVVFFTIHYLFASQTAHVGALYCAFLALLLSAGTPPLLAALSLAYTSNLFGSITQFASGQAAVYYGAGYMTLQEVYKIGAIFGLFNLVLWLGVGLPWWKVLGWW